MSRFSLAVDIKMPADSLREIERLARDGEQVAGQTAVAINETVKGVRTFISKEIRGRVAIPKRLIDRRLQITLASKGDLRGQVSVQHETRLSLGDFGPKKAPGGVTYLLATGQRKFVRGAFVKTLPRKTMASDGRMSYEQVFWRTPDARSKVPGDRRGYRRSGKSTLPILSLKGVSAWGVLTSRKAGILPLVQAEAQRRLEKAIDRRLQYLTLKRSPLPT